MENQDQSPTFEPIDLDKDYTIEDVAFLFGVVKHTVRSWIHGEHGFKLDARKEHGRWLITGQAIKDQANRLYGEHHGK